MGIDWKKAEDKPEKSQSIQGRILLDLRHNSDNLEEELAKAKKELETTQRDLSNREINYENSLQEKNDAVNELKKKLGIMEIECKRLSEKYNNLKKELDETNQKLENTINELSDTKSSLSTKIEEINELKTEYQQKLSSKDNKIEELKTQNSQLNEKINSLKEELENKPDNTEIEELKTQNSQLNEKVNDLNSIVSEKEALLQDVNNLLLEKDTHIKQLEIELNPSEISVEEDTTSKERTVCPKCGAVGANIKTVEDKTKVFSYVGGRPMYAHKKICKKCATEF